MPQFSDVFAHNISNMNIVISVELIWSVNVLEALQIIKTLFVGNSLVL